MKISEPDYAEQIEHLEYQVPHHPARALADHFRERGAASPLIYVEITSRDVTLLWVAPDKEIVVAQDVTAYGELYTYIRYHGIVYTYTGLSGVEKAKEAVHQITQMFAGRG